MLIKTAHHLMENWAKYKNRFLEDLLSEIESLCEMQLMIELLEEHPELLGALLSIDNLGRIRFALQLPPKERFDLILKLQQMYEHHPDLELFRVWSPHLLDTSFLSCLADLETSRWSSSEQKRIFRWCAHFGLQESMIVPGVFFRSLPMRSSRFGHSAQPVVLNHRFAMLKYPITQGMYAFWTGEISKKAPGEPQVFQRVLDVLRLCNTISEAQGRKKVYGPSELLNQNASLQSLSRVDQIGGWYGGMELEELMDSITINMSADGWRIPSEVEWECAAKAELRGGFEDALSQKENHNSIYFNYVGGDQLSEVGCVQQTENGRQVLDVVGQKRLNGYGLSDMSGAVSELCWGEGFPPYFEDMIHPVPVLEDPFLYGTDEEERQSSGRWSVRGGVFKSLESALNSNERTFVIRLVRTLF